MSLLSSLMGVASNGARIKVKYVYSGITSQINGLSMTRPISNVKAGDLILVFHSAASGTGGSQLGVMSLNTTGYTLLRAYFTSNSNNYDTNLEIYGKIADGTETSVVSNGGLNAAFGSALAVGVYRGTDGTLPDASRFTVNNAGDNDDVIFPTTTTIEGGDLLVVFGANATNSPSFTAPTDLDEWIYRGANDSYDNTLGLGSILITDQTSFTANTWVAPNSSSYFTHVGGYVRLRA